MVEPLEETRTELIFATEPILSSLELSIPGSKRSPPLVELDEVEVCLVLRRRQIIDDFTADPEGYIADLQRPIFSAFFCKINTHEYMSGEYHHQQCCQFIYSDNLDLFSLLNALRHRETGKLLDLD